ncbi:MAG: hypothetical protein GX131_13270 [candidate division WS1 bacterium]|jgi:uncharacterized membrane protein (Fun14 family)|nr:hypothetical protein [candidate division WS1 bacterium]
MVTVSTILGTLGAGGLLGYFAGTAVKGVSRLLGCLLGIVFILMQVLAYYGIAEWHWDKISEFIMGPAATAAGSASAKLWAILTWNLPFGGGFATGFYLGMRR